MYPRNRYGDLGALNEVLHDPPAAVGDIGDRHRLDPGDIKPVAGSPDARAHLSSHPRWEISVETAASLGQRLERASVDWVVTDPPYGAKSIPAYDELGAAAARILKPGGLLLCMTGQFHLPEVMGRLGRHLSWHWLIPYLTPGSSAENQKRRVHVSSKPVLVYAKGTYGGSYFTDVAESPKADKEHHHWGQSVGGMLNIMRSFVRPGDTIVDPFLGGGTTGLAALQLGANFVGCDIDPDAVALARSRLEALRQESHLPQGTVSGSVEPISLDEERAAIIEHDGKIPRDWADGFAGLHPDRPPGDVPLKRWQQFLDDIGGFLDAGWAETATALGWGPLDLFGCDRHQPFARIDCSGILWLLNGGKVVELDHEKITIQTRGAARQTYRRKPDEPGRVLAWELVR